MLAQSPILIVEDEPFIALTLKASVEDAGGKVVGPVGSVHAALALLDTDAVVGAILDVQLSDGDVTPVAEVLCSRRIPVIFQSGVGLPHGLEERCPGAPLYRKPAASEAIVEKLVAMIDG